MEGNHIGEGCGGRDLSEQLIKPKIPNGLNGFRKHIQHSKSNSVIPNGVNLSLHRDRSATPENTKAMDGIKKNGYYNCILNNKSGSCLQKDVTVNGDVKNKSDKITSTSSPKKIRQIGVRKTQESYEQCSLLDAFYTYLCYFVLVVVGYFKDFMRPVKVKEKNREGYVPLYASFESFYTRHVYRRVRDCWNIPVCSVPGEYISLMERVSPDYGWTFEMTGRELKCINLGSYNYLGFAQNHGSCAEAAVEKVRSCGVAVCSTRRELGNAAYLDELDELVARFVGSEDAITCAMGFATNALNLPIILNKGCLVLSDEKNHASIILGLRLSGATIRVFKHNNMKSLEKRIREGIIYGQPRTHLPWEKIFIVVEGVYSMEGSIVKLPEIIDLKRKYGVYLYMDEAHSIGAIGSHGRGVVDYWGLDPRDVDVLMGTFTKSFGSAGGYIAGSRDLIEMLRESSHAHCYGSSMSAPVAQQIITSMKIIMGEDGTDEGIKKIGRLARNSKYFRQKLKQNRFIVYGNDDSPVVPVALYMPSKITYVIREMIKRGVATVGVGFPATPLVQGRTRFCLSAAHTKEMLDHAIEAMSIVGDNIQARTSCLPVHKGEIRYEDVELEDVG